MVHRTIIDVILHLFIICNDLWCQLPFFSQTFRHNGSAVFGTMPPMCRSCPDVNKLRGMETTILGQHRPFMSIKSFVQHSGWQEMVSLCSLIRLIGVCADRDQPGFLCSRSDSRHLEVHVATAGGWLTRYRPREVRNSIYRYRKIHIDYRSKFLYRFISPISIIYGNTTGLNELTCYLARQTNWVLLFQSCALRPFNNRPELACDVGPIVACYGLFTWYLSAMQITDINTWNYFVHFT